jgi:hypothetical protein
MTVIAAGGWAQVHHRRDTFIYRVTRRFMRWRDRLFARASCALRGGATGLPTPLVYKISDVDLHHAASIPALTLDS